jgi:hypothetical protein
VNVRNRKLAAAMAPGTGLHKSRICAIDSVFEIVSESRIFPVRHDYIIAQFQPEGRQCRCVIAKLPSSGIMAKPTAWRTRSAMD